MTLRSVRMLGGIMCVAALLVAPALALAADESTKPATQGEAPAAGGHTGASTHEEGGGGGLINLDKSLLVQIVNFLILLFVLHRLLYRPLLAKMEERSVAIKRSLDEAQAARAEAAKQQDENTARLRAAYQEAAAIRDQALKDAADEQKRLVDGARAEAQRLLEAAKAQTDADIRRAREELRREVADLATGVAEKLIRKSLRDEDHRRVVADALARVGS